MDRISFFVILLGFFYEHGVENAVTYFLQLPHQLCSLTFTEMTGGCKLPLGGVKTRKLCMIINTLMIKTDAYLWSFPDGLLAVTTKTVFKVTSLIYLVWLFSQNYYCFAPIITQFLQAIFPPSKNIIQYFNVSLFILMWILAASSFVGALCPC